MREATSPHESKEELNHRGSASARPIHYAVLMSFCAFLIGLLGKNLISERFVDMEDDPLKPNPNLARRWARAVASGDANRAILLAKSLVSDQPPTLPVVDYLTLCDVNKIPSTALTKPFNRLDFARWRDASEAATIVKERVRDPHSAPMDLAKAVITEVKQLPADAVRQFPPVSVMEAWRNGGNVADRVRLLSELISQTGRDVCVVALLGDDNRHIHYLCEVRGKGDPVVIDVPFATVFPNKTVADLRRTPKSLPRRWPETHRNALMKGRMVYLIPAEFADYRLVNQKLRTALEQSGVKNLPKFGMDPFQRVETYFPKNKVPPSAQRGYWQMPFLALHSIKGAPRDKRNE